MALDSSQKLKGVRVQFIQYDGGTLLKRGRTVIKLGTKPAAKAVQLILQATTKKGATIQEIYQLFSRKSRPLVQRLVTQLITWNLLIPDSPMNSTENPESNLDLFYWEFRQGSAGTIQQLNRLQITILGVNYISRQIVTALMRAGVEHLKIIDHPFLRNLRLFDSDGKLLDTQWANRLENPIKWADKLDPKGIDCMVVTSDFGRSPLFYEMNTFCVTQKCHFLPVVLHNLNGYVGPLVIPGETACFDCLRSRRNSHLEDPDLWQACENVAFAGKELAGFHPSMPSVLGEIATFELTRFYGGPLDSTKIGTLIEIDLVEARMTARKVLKIPRCVTCSPMNVTASTNPDKTLFIPLDWGDRR